MDPRPDAARDGRDDGRDESPVERADRNWDELLQEFRVLQTGTQILTGFLLAGVFQQRFEDLDTVQVSLYIVLVALAALATMVALTPVVLHRALFGRGRKPDLVRIGARAMGAALVVLGVLTVGVTAFIIDVALGRTAGIVALVLAAAALLVLWALVPVRYRRSLRSRRWPDEPPQVGKPSESPR